MKKLILIGLKDVKLAFRDRPALLLMLLAPFALTLGLGFVTGSFSTEDGSGIGSIPVILVNQDDGQLGAAVLELFHSDDMRDLITAADMSDADEARLAVDNDAAAAVIIIPPGFTDSVIPAEGMETSSLPAVQIQLYSNPTRPTSAGVVRSILEQFINRLEIARIGGQVTIAKMIAEGLILPQEAMQTGTRIGEELARRESTAITLKGVTNTGADTDDFNVLAYMAPGMALMFLMYTVSYGGRSLLAERDEGTLPRLLITPTSAAQVLGGKIMGVFLTGAAQMFILITATSLLFGLQWGDWLGVVVLVLAAVFAASGWGMLVTVLGKTPGTVQWMGTSITLLFGLLGGSFFDPDVLPFWFRMAGRITPNAWGLDGFVTLAQGGRLSDIGLPLAGLLVMGALLFALAALLFRRSKLARL
jgi:ABC-2 type transport system permease protein